MEVSTILTSQEPAFPDSLLPASGGLGCPFILRPPPPSTVQPAAHAEQNNWPQRSGHQGTRFLPGRPALEELRWWQHPWPLPERPDRGGRAGPADTVTSPLWPFLLALLLVLKRNDVFTRWGWGAQLDKRGTREWRLREMCASICGHSQPHAREDRR